MILALNPELVGPTAHLLDVPMGYEFEPAYRGWITDDRSKVGHIGAPRHSCASKGEHLFECYAKGVAGFLKKVAAWQNSTIGEGWQSA
jgi:creatinine amidohydrolase/Fe(II)-dependent formamide hydrolase-like protein